MRAEGLTKAYGSGETTVHPLRRLSIDFDAEQFTAVMGPSGSGKSTLLHVLAGLDTADEGTITLRTDDGGHCLLSGLNEKDLTRVRRDNILLPSSLGSPPHSGTTTIWSLTGWV